MSRRWLCPMFLFVLVAVTLTVGLSTNAAAQAKKKPDPQHKRLHRLEEQVRKQSQQLEQMQKLLEQMRRQQNATPAPAPPAAIPSASPPSPREPTPAPGPSGPVIDESVPPAPGPSPGPEVPPAPSATPTPGGPMIDETVPPPEGAPPVRPGGTPAPYQGTAPQGPTGGPASAAFMNPAISAIGLFEVRTSNDKSNQGDNRPSVREVEVALQAPVDPFARYDIFLTAGNNESVGVEEAYGTFFNLPLGFQAKGGLFKAAFGRNNQLHTHAYPQIDRPEVVQQFFGEEGLSGAGLSLSNILPLPWYSEVILEAFANDNATLFSAGASQKPVYNASWRNLFDLREDLTLEAGLSGSYGANDTNQIKDTRVAGASLTLKYKPLRQLGQFGVVWESEYLTETQRVPFLFQSSANAAINGLLPPSVTKLGNRSANGWYSYVDVQANRNWFFGLRYDHTHLPIDPTKIESGWTPYVGYRFSEFNSFRVQYTNLSRNWDKALQRFYAQWNIVIGPHGAHKY